RKINFAAMNKDRSRDAAGIHEVVHTVNAAEEGGFATTGGSDEGRDAFFGDLEVDGVERLMFAVEEVDFSDFDGRMIGRRGSATLTRLRVGGRGLNPDCGGRGTGRLNR